MFQRKPARRAAPRVRATAAQLAAIASPVRQEVIDTVEALGGEASIAELASQLGRPADGLYYHVRLLCRAELLRELAPDGASRGRGERRYRSVAGKAPLRLRYARADRASAAAASDVVDAMTRIARRDHRRGLTLAPVVDGPRRTLWAGRAAGWASDAELAAINRHLAALEALLRRPRAPRRRHLVSLCFVLAPMPIRPARR